MLLTEQMIDELPCVDIHVHLPGTISPYTAWELGVRNRFIEVSSSNWGIGNAKMSEFNPHKNYVEIFKWYNEIGIDDGGKPINLYYDFASRGFQGFDMVMATVQGHRYPRGGIQNESDLELIFDSYCSHCVDSNIFYTELQQNIRIAYQVYHYLPEHKARESLYKFFAKIVEKFKMRGVHLRFLHCFNKTTSANMSELVSSRAIKYVNWLREAHDIAPGVFVGLGSAGYEGDMTGWPIHLKDAYYMAREMGLGCEAHGGEHIGVEHMMDVVHTLPINRLAHGFQVIEDLSAITHIKNIGLPLIMMPIINMQLSSYVHAVKNKDGDFIAVSKSNGGSPEHIKCVNTHPFFSLIREHGLKIALSSDNPFIGGVPLKKSIKILAGLKQGHYTPPTNPLSAEELLSCSLNGIQAAFCTDTIKQEYLNKLIAWAQKYNVPYSKSSFLDYFVIAKSV